MNPDNIREKAGEALALLKAIASENRLMILCQLVDQECSVGELAQRLGITETVVSQHLRLLRKDRLVRTRRDGQTIHYALEGEEARRILETLYDIFCSPDSDTGK
jgi:DNA-binding transcriptional ArsR family regulator